MRQSGKSFSVAVCTLYALISEHYEHVHYYCKHDTGASSRFRDQCESVASSLGVSLLFKLHKGENFDKMSVSLDKHVQ